MTILAGVKRIALSLLVVALFAFASAQTVIEFWHSQDATEALIEQFAAEFNAAQDRYRVVPRTVGSYQEGAIRLIAALRSGTPPALFDAELTVYARLVDEGSLLDLADLAAELPSDLTADLYPLFWDYGSSGGARYGLPWNLSVPVLIYNASVLVQRGVEPPTTWQEFEAAAGRLTTRNTQGYIDVAGSFIFEAMVTSRGGSLVTEDGLPNFTSPEAVEALTMLQRMARAGHSIPRSFTELDQALVDFARGRGMMAIASQAFFPQGERFTVTFDVAAAPLPGTGPVPLTGAQLVVPRGVSDDARRGAFEFWHFLLERQRIESWVRTSLFLPVRRSVAEQLEAWYDESPERRAGIDQLDRAAARPRTGEYALWQTFLAEEIERVTKGRADPLEALQEAQRRALESR